MKICKYCLHQIIQSVAGWGVDEDIITGEETYFHVECAETNGGILREA